MEKFRVLGILFVISTLLISGCGNTDDKVVDGDKDKPVFTVEPEEVGGSKDFGDGYGFSEFDLEIEVDGKEVINIDYNVKKEADAEYDNRLKDFHLKDAEAMNAIHELFFHLRLRKDMGKEDITRKILEFLQIENYSKFELEVDYDDGTVLEINDVK